MPRAIYLLAPGASRGGNDEENDAYFLGYLSFIFCAWMFCLNVCMHTTCVQRLEEGVGSLEIGDTDS